MILYIKYIFKIMIPITNIETTESIQGKLLQENVVESSTQIPSPLEYLEFYSFLWFINRAQEVHDLSTDGYQSYITYE